jgi:hypothetical protein
MYTHERLMIYQSYQLDPIGISRRIRSSTVVSVLDTKYGLLLQPSLRFSVLKDLLAYNTTNSVLNAAFPPCQAAALCW